MIFWVNNDVVPHTILSEDGTWSTGMIESGKLGSMSFNQTGIYKYFIKEKPDKTGIIDFSGLVDLDDN
jgi:plastocyanin